MEVAGMITRCRLNKKTKDKLILSRCLWTGWEKDVASLGSWTYFLELFEEDKQEIEREDLVEDNSSMHFESFKYCLFRTRRCPGACRK